MFSNDAKHTFGRRQFTGGCAALAAGAAVSAAPLPVPRAAAVEDPEVTKFTSQHSRIAYLGQPVRSQIGSQSPMIGYEDGRWVAYQVFKGSANTDLPATFRVTDVSSGALVRQIKIPTADSARVITIASDGKVYIPTAYEYHLWRYDPATKALTDLGAINPDSAREDAFGAGAGPNGMVFLGTYPSSKLYRWNPATAKVEDCGVVNPDEDYIHAVCWDPAGTNVYCVTGGKQASIWKITNLGMGTRTKIIDATDIPALGTSSFLSALDFIDGHLVARLNASLIVADPNGVIKYWKGTAEIAGYHPVPCRDGDGFWFGRSSVLKRYRTSTHAVTTTTAPLDGDIRAGVELTDGRLVGAGSTGVFVANPSTGALTTHPISFQQPTQIQKIFRGPNNTIYASGYMVGLAQVNKTGGTPYPTLNLGQYESCMIRSGLMYLGSYGYARLSSYDPATPLTAPTLLATGQTQGQDRPFGMAYNPARAEVYLGAVPGYGKNQGGLCVYNFTTKTYQWYTTELITNQSIVSVAHTPATGLVHIGTTIDGGMGGEPSGQTEGRLISWDPVTKTVVRSIVPVPGRQGVTGLLQASDGSVWGVAEEILFRVFPDGTVTTYGAVSGRYPAPPSYTWAWAQLTWSAKDPGYIWGTAGGNLVRINTGTGGIAVIASGGASWACTDETGDIYFSYRTRQFVYRWPTV